MSIGQKKPAIVAQFHSFTKVVLKKNNEIVMYTILYLQNVHLQNEFILVNRIR